jgi:hypothetical protein
VDRGALERVRAELRASSSDGVHASKEAFDKHFEQHDPLLRAQLWDHVKREDAAGGGKRGRAVSVAAIDSVSRLWAKSNNARSSQVDLLCQVGLIGIVYLSQCSDLLYVVRRSHRWKVHRNHRNGVPWHPLS